ncbi:MAG: dipeptidase [Acidobacteriota bacterium]|nr:dipeptidase [Acidobacteriota bacterium]
MEPRNPRLDLWLLSLTRRPRPRVLFVPTATGDSKDYIRRFYKAFDRLPCEPQHLQLFNRTAVNVREPILASDLIFVGGGNTANLLAVWRVHGVDRALREAWENGVVLAGVSAGAICWFEAGVTDSFGLNLQPLTNALALLPGSFCPHYDGDPARRPAFHRLVAEGALPDGLAADDGAAILFEETSIADVVRSRPRVAAYRVTRNDDGALEERLEARLLLR